jgi:aminomethyltransferase
MIEIDYVSAHKALIESHFSTPYELNLGWTVHLDKPRFNGREALAAEKARGSSWQFVGIDVDWVSLETLFAEHHLPPRVPGIAWRTSIPIYASGRQVGYASSGCWSPLLKRMLALAHLEAPWAAAGTPVTMEVTVEHRRREAAAAVAPLPFFNPERKRS